MKDIGYQLYNHDCRQMNELEDNSVHCVVTSPPYWGLRKYAGEQDLIWGGNKDCQHEWGSEIITTNRGSVGLKAQVRSNQKELQGNVTNNGNFCQVCGAWRGAYGHEPTVELFIKHSVEILREIRRVLRKDGVVFWNIGDSYASGKGTCYNPGGGENSLSGHKTKKDAGVYPLNRGNISDLRKSNLKPKDLCLIPQRLAVALQEDGWWVRSLIIWNKTNPMPESVNGWRWERHQVKVKAQPQERRQKARIGQLEDEGRTRPDNIGGVYVQKAEYEDCPGCSKCEATGGYVLRRGSWRPTESHEYILMLAKSSQYYCDMEAVREPYTEPMNRWGGPTLKTDTSKTAEYKEMQQIGYSSILRPGRVIRPDESGRNMRSVWTFPTRPLPKAYKHFAAFPERLPELCIKAATPEVGVCAECGAPWARVIERNNNDHSVHSDTAYSENDNAGRLAKLRQTARENGEEYYNATQTIGWQPTCHCKTDARVSATVLDPFSGAGTTLLEALKLGRQAIGYDIASEYRDITLDRLAAVQPILLPTKRGNC